MDSFVINMKNSTQAYKARAALARSGISSRVERTHRQHAGCSFALRIFADKGLACPLLSRMGIHCDLPR